MQGTNRSGVEGGKADMCDPGSDLRLEGREKRGAKMMNEMEGKIKKHRHRGYSPVMPVPSLRMTR